MSEQTAMSIKVSVGPLASDGLAALAARHLAKPSADPAAEERGRGKGRTTISNKLTGNVTGTVFQIGTVHNMNTPDGR